MSYNTKRGSKVPAKRSSFKTTVRPYSPPTNKVNPMLPGAGGPSSPTGRGPNSPPFSAISGSGAGAGGNNSVTSPSNSINSHVRARTYAANNRNAKISQLQSHDNHIMDPPGSKQNNTNGINDFGTNADGLGMISESAAQKPSKVRDYTTPGGGINGVDSRLKQNSASKHMPSQSIAVLSGGLQSQESLEKFRHELRDVIWTEANVLDSKQGYRMYIWKHMAKNIWLPTASDLPAKFKYESYKDGHLANDEEKAGSGRDAAKVTNANFHHNRNKSISGRGVEEDDGAETAYNGESITYEKLQMYLKRRETYGHFIEDPSNVVFVDQVEAQMKNVLTAYAIANHNRFSLVGVVQLCAVILTTTKKEADTFYLLQILTVIMREYYQNDEEAIKNETLLLVDILCTNDQDLVNTLKRVNIDVIDLSMLTCTWVRSLFAQHFLLPFIKRVIDLVLLEGPSVLTAIVYGIFCLMKSDLCQCESDHQVFDMLSGANLKDLLRQPPFINQVILKAQLLHGKSNNKFISQNRNIKSWTEMIKLPGNKYFRLKSGVGDERRTKKELKSVSKNGFDMFDRKEQNELGFDSDTDSDKEENEIGLLKKNMKDAQEEITRLKGTIERFQSMHLDPAQLMLTTQSMTALGHPQSYQISNNNSNHSNGVGSNGINGINGIHGRISRNQNSVEFHEDGVSGVPSSQIQDGGAIDEEPGNVGDNFGQLAQMQEEQRMLNNMGQMNSNPSLDHTNSGHYQSMSSLRSNGAKTVAELLHMSPDGTEVYLEPLVGGYPDDDVESGTQLMGGMSSEMNNNSNAREIQCRTENWTHSWKHAISTLDDVSLTMQGYLCKMTASKWNTRGTFEKVQRRYFVLKGHYLTYFKTHHHQAPKGDKCISILQYTINPVVHAKSKFAFEVISPPKDRDSRISGVYSNSGQNDSSSRNNKDRYIREKFIILPDCDTPESEHKFERNKWIKALRFASKGQNLWDPLLGVQALYNSGNNGANITANSMSGSSIRKAHSDITSAVQSSSRYNTNNGQVGDNSNNNSPN